MKKLFYLFLMLPLFFVACSDDDDNGDGGNGGDGTPGKEVVLDPSKVFTAGLPKDVDGWATTYNTNGWLTAMEDKVSGSKITFTYANNVKTKMVEKPNYDVLMTYKDGYDDYVIRMVLGDNGFVSHAYQTYADGTKDTWSFKYNSDGQLIKMIRSEGGNEVTTIVYKDGNIIKVIMASDEVGEGFEAEITYTSEAHKDGIDNKGCIMLFDETFGVHIDEMDYAYFAGLLGKATKKLPLQYKEVETSGTYTYNYNWTLNEQGLPIKMIETEVGAYDEIYEFQW